MVKILLVIPKLHRNFAGIHRLLPCQIDRQESGRHRLFSVTHRGQARSHRISTMDTDHVRLLRFHPVVLRWRFGSCRKSYTVMPRYKPALFRSPVRPDESKLLKKLKPPGPLSGERRFNTVYPDSMRCLSASLRCDPEGPRCPQDSEAENENQDSVNEALLTEKHK